MDAIDLTEGKIPSIFQTQKRDLQVVKRSIPLIRHNEKIMVVNANEAKKKGESMVSVNNFAQKLIKRATNLESAQKNSLSTTKILLSRGIN